MNIDLPLNVYRFAYQALDEVHFPNQPGFLWHSVFGKALHDLVCVVKGTECERCMFLHQCDYPNLFRGSRPPGSAIMRKYNSIPSPHIFRPALDHPLHVKPDTEISVDVILPGAANERLPSLIRALYSAGMTGLGKNRGRMQLQQVWQLKPGGEDKALLDGSTLLDADPPEALPTPQAPASVTLKFLTPYKPSGKAATADGIDVGRYLMAIIRRVDLMQYFYTGVKLDVDFKQLKSLTESIVVADMQLQKKHDRRYSAAHQRTQDMSGFVGSLTLDLRGHEALWPFLWVGQWLNVGKHTSMGMGRYGVG